MYLFVIQIKIKTETTSDKTNSLLEKFLKGLSPRLEQTESGFVQKAS